MRVLVAGDDAPLADFLEVWKSELDTMTNVVDVYINYLRRKVDFVPDRPVIPTIRRVGYQIGEDLRTG